MADLAATLDLPVILVVGMRLGCINHALLSAEAIGPRLCGWVANLPQPAMAALAGNLQSLRSRMPTPCLGWCTTVRPPKRRSTRLSSREARPPGSP